MSAPLVTGISPKEGPPGTKVTIRGERLGKSLLDIVALDICGVNCLLTAEWVSPKKIMARTLLCRGRGEVVIVTKSGGIGTCTVQFRGSQDSVSLTKESSVWVDEGTLVGPRPMSKSSLQQDDPLQISLEANEKKFPVEELLDSFPGKCGNLCAENYSPHWFLLEFHHATAFEDLKSGLHYLGRKIGSQSEGKISFLKENLYMVMDQLDSLSELRKVCDLHDESRSTSTNHSRIAEIDEQIAVCEKEAARMFLEVLARKDRADITRSALGGYQRFRFLLGLPATMQRSIDNGDYDIAISDYTRSKALFHQAEAQKSVFQKFQIQVEQIAATLRNTLKAKLVQKPPNLDDQRVIISYLSNLEVDYDPAWTCLQSHYEFLTVSLSNCFKILSESPESQQKPTDPEQVSWNREVNCVESICEIFCGYFVAFWQLSQEYFGGKLRIKPELSKQADVKVMMLGAVETFSKALSACIMPYGTNKSEFKWKNPSAAQVRWISLCLNSVRKTYTKVLTLDPPMEISEAFRSLLFDIRSYSLSVMANQMSAEVSDLGKFEDWCMEYQKDHGFITALPSKFESALMNSAKLIKEMILQKYSKEKSLIKSQHVMTSLTENVANACSSFADAIETLLTEQKNILMTAKSKENGNATVAMRLLLMLNNCSYVRNTTFPSITRAVSALGFPNVSDALMKSNNSVMNVERLVFTHYTEMKYEPVVGMIEQAMFVGAFDWEKLGEPNGVRPYISKVLMGLVQVIAEVSNAVTTVSEKLTYRVMSQVIESVSEELLRLYSCVATFSHGGALQAVVDVLAFEHAVEHYLSSTSKSLLEQAVELLPSSATILKSKDVRDLLEQYKTNSALQLQPLGR